jgi:hypothetical protein
MSDAVLEAHEIVRLAAEPWQVGDGVKEGITRAARSLGIGYRRARTFWYCQPCAVLSVEMDRMRLRKRELLFERMRRLDAERDYVAAKIAALEETRADLVAHVARGALDTKGAAGAEPCGTHPAPAGAPAARIAA